MNINEIIKAVKIEENAAEVRYQYGHIVLGDVLTGELKISNTEYPSVTTVQLEQGFSTRANEMRIGGKIILQHQLNGIWPEIVIL